MNRIYDDITWTGNPEMDSIIARKRWLEKARPNQIPNLYSHYGYLLMAGRGFGKSMVLSCTGFQIACEVPGIRIAVVCRTGADVRGTMWSGDSGLINNIPPSCFASPPTFKPLEIKLWNGSTFYGFSAEEPTGLRGPAFGAGLLDELAFWNNLGLGMDCPLNMVRIATRIPTKLKTKLIAGTTPDDVETLYDLQKDPRWVKVTGSTFQNIENLDTTYINETIPDLMAKAGTAMSEMEIEGILRPREETVVFKRNWFKYWPKRVPLPRFTMIIESLDTAFSERTAADHSASSIWGVFNNENYGGLGLILLGCWKQRLNYPDLKARVLSDFHTGHGPEGKHFVSTFLVEWKGSGISLVQELQETTSIPIQGVLPLGRSGANDKVTRASLVSHIVEKGHVWIPENEYEEGEIAEWAKPFLDEVCRFSNSKRALKSQSDDWTDTFVQCLRWINDNGIGREPSEVLDKRRLISQNSARTFQNPYLK